MPNYCPLFLKITKFLFSFILNCLLRQDYADFQAWLAVNRRPSSNLKKKEYHIKEKQCCISNKLIIKIMIIVVFIGLFFQQLGCLFEGNRAWWNKNSFCAYLQLVSVRPIRSENICFTKLIEMVVQSVNQLKNFKFNCLHIPVWAKILGARIF